MPSLAVMWVLLRETITRKRSDRVPEPALIMEDPDQVAAYTRAGGEDGVMAPVYLFHCAQICEILKNGDTALDLACGPANQLAQVARLNPAVNFTGVDLSREMLDRAKTHVTEMGLSNVSLLERNITDLSCFQDNSVDAVFSTMALHHLPDEGALIKTFSEVARVLKPGGGLYLVDFARLKSEKSINYFAYQYEDRQPELFTLDYLYSLKAAFSLDDFVRSAQVLNGVATVKSTFLVPYMVALKSRPRSAALPDVMTAIQEMRAALPAYHKVDLDDLITFFRLGRISSCYLR